MKITIEGYRCYQKAEYIIKDGQIILLSGPSGCGKTTLLQTIYWCLYGGLKNVYNNNGYPKCSVTLEFDNHQISFGVNGTVKAKSLIIYRQKRSELLRVTIDNNIYEDHVAQSIINENFGLKDMWIASSYLQQGEKCGLLLGTNNERMDLLNQLSFSTDDPETCISRIDVELKEVTNQFTILQTQFTTVCEQFSHQLDTEPVDIDCLLAPSDIQLKEHELKEQKSLLHSLSLQQSTQQTLKGKYISLSDQLLLIQSKLKEIPQINDGEIKDTEKLIADLETKIIETKEAYQLFTKYELLQEQLKTINSHLPAGWQDTFISYRNKFTQADLVKLKYQEQLYHQNESKCKQLGCKYNSADINLNIDKLHQELQSLLNQEQYQYLLKNFKSCQDTLQNHQTTIPKLQQQLTVKQQELEALENSIPTNLPNIESLESEIATTHQLLIKSQHLTCPHCGKKVKYHSSNSSNASVKLQPVESIDSSQSYEQIKNTHEELTKTYDHAKKLHKEKQEKSILVEKKKSEIGILITTINDKIERYNQLVIQYQEYQEQLNNYQHQSSENTPIQTQIKDAQNKLSILSSIQIIELTPVKSDIIEHIIKFEQIEDKIKSIPNELTNKLTNELTNKLTNELTLDFIKSLETQLIDLKKSYQQKLHHESLRSQLLSQEKGLKEKLIEIIGEINEGIDGQCTECKQMIENLESLITKAKYANKMKKWQDDLENQRDQLIQLQTDMISLQKLKQTALNVECHQLQLTVDSINLTMADIFAQIFEDPIIVTLNLFKTIKSGHKIKPTVNLSINYKGSEYDNINQLSGGEAARISLGLLLSLNRISTSSLLLIDEGFSALNGHLRELCLKVIRNNVPKHKTVLIISHEDVEGYYDDVIRF